MEVAEVGEAHVAGLEDAAVGPAVAVELGGAIGQPADVKLVKMAVGPAERRLQHLMELGEVEIEGQLKAATDGGMNIDNMDIGADDEGVGFKHVRDYAAGGAATSTDDNYAAIPAAAAAVRRR